MVSRYAAHCAVCEALVPDAGSQRCTQHPTAAKFMRMADRLPTCPTTLCDVSCDFSGLPKHKCSHCGGRGDTADASGDSDADRIRQNLKCVVDDDNNHWIADCRTLLRALDATRDNNRKLVNSMASRIAHHKDIEDKLRAQLTETEKVRDEWKQAAADQLGKATALEERLRSLESILTEFTPSSRADIRLQDALRRLLPGGLR